MQESSVSSPPLGSHPSCGHKAMWRHAGRKYARPVSTQPKIASPSAETQQHGASGLQQSAQGPRKFLTFSVVRLSRAMTKGATGGCDLTGCAGGCGGGLAGPGGGCGVGLAGVAGGCGVGLAGLAGGSAGGLEAAAFPVVTPSPSMKNGSRFPLSAN